jgi:hypothetical protein
MDSALGETTGEYVSRTICEPGVALDVRVVPVLKAESDTALDKTTGECVLVESLPPTSILYH